MRALAFVPVALAASLVVEPVSAAGLVTRADEPAAAAALLAQAVAPIPLESVLQVIEQRFPGRALGARVVDRGGQRIYRIKWLGDNGRVQEILADVESGKILQVR